MSRTRPQLNTADPAQLEAASDILDEGEALCLGILIAARQERLRGGLSDETVDALELIECEGQQEVHRLVLLCDHYRDAKPSAYQHVKLHELRAISPVNATRCDADDAYRRAEWLHAAMLYEAAADATESAGTREEWLDRARDCRRQAYRDGLSYVDPGPSTREPQNDWERILHVIDRQDRRSIAMLIYEMDAIAWCSNVSAVQWSSVGALVFAAGRDKRAVEFARNLPAFQAGVSLQVAALCGDRDLFDRSWSVLESRCKEPWQKRRREILTPRECREMIDALL